LKNLYRLDVSDAARADLSSARLWLHQPGSGSRARSRYQAILAAIQDLKTSPGRWPSGVFPGIRERPVAGHRIFYRLDPEGRRVRIMRIFSPYQDRADP
jgi:plasmid stabilization system protein ParE